MAVTTLLFLVVSVANGQNTSLTLKFHKDSAEVFECVQMDVMGMPMDVNPFDPDSVTVDLEVTAPSGKTVHVPGFWGAEFSRKLVENREVLSPGEEGAWHIRWMPREAGRHTLVALLTVKGKPAGRGDATFNIVEGPRKGVAHVEPRGKRYFQLDDGSPLFLNGLCSCWHGQRGTFDYDDWLAAYEKAGINYIRIWMWHEAFGIEWNRGDIVHYRLDSAWRLDRVLAEAQRRGIYVMLCLDYHGIFEVKPDFWGGNNFWPINPYNATNGGPCKVQNDFFTNDQARKLYQKRLRYIVARWSAFSNILAWEFFNEIDNEYAYLKHEDVVAWHRDMGKYLRSIDPVQHMITSSFTGGSEKPDLYALPEMDFAQYHSYNENHPAEMVAEKTARFHAKYQKPFYVSEYGTDWRGWKPETDPHFRALHQAIWNGVFAGSAGTSMTWFWESIHANNLYSHFSVLSAFLKDTGVGGGQMAPASFTNATSTIKPFGIATRNEALVWLLDRAYDWPDGAKDESPKELKGARVTLTGVDNGTWTVEWWNTLSGKAIATNEIKAVAGTLELTAPDFQADIAARMKKHE